MKKSFHYATGMLISATIIFSACSKSDDNPPPPTPQPQVKIVHNATFGDIITDSLGRTLYFFAADADGKSACTGGCLALWPTFYKEDPTVSAGLKESDFSDMVRSDNAEQSTFKTWPLYYYANDVNPGDVNGDGVGGVWFVAKANYTLMLTRAQLVGADGKSYKADYTEGTANTIYLVDSVGRTLYAFSPDHFKVNKYTKSDFSNDATWPIFQVGAASTLPSALHAADFSSIQVFGKTQLTFKGWPLYYFGPDGTTRGKNTGVSVPTPGFWPIVNNDSPVAPQ